MRPSQRLQWIALCAVAEFVGIGLAAAWYGGTMLWLGEPPALGARVGVWLLALLAAVPEGLVLGGLQAWGLKRHVPDLSARRFIAATVLVGLIGWGIGAFIPMFLFFEPQADVGTAAEPGLAATTLFAAVFGGIAGALFGGFQALALPPSVQRRAPWVLANTVGWTVALPLIYVAAQWGADLPASWAVKWLLWAGSGLAAGACVGIATAWAIPKLRA
jgi:hypothetical protein